MRAPRWIEEGDVLALHNRLLAIDGGIPGVRDAGLLKSALARPKQIYAYGEDADTVRLACAYTVGIVRNHPFLDGNKRTGFVTGALFLELNGGRFRAPEEDATYAVLRLAGNTADEVGFIGWMRGHVTFG